MPNVTTEEVAYAAGFFDGEGHICIAYNPLNKCVNRYGKVYFYERFQLYVSVGQKDKTPLVWLKDKFGGHLHHKSQRRSYDKKQYFIWTWMLNSAKAIEFLKLIRPFLIVKAKEADVAFEFYATIDRANRRKIDPKIVQLRQQAFDNIRLLRKGKR